MATRVEAYRVRAIECEAMAAHSTDPKAQITFAELAKHWRRLADKIEAMVDRDEQQ
jgi:hypothetical protein